MLTSLVDIRVELGRDAVGRIAIRNVPRALGPWNPRHVIRSCTVVTAHVVYRRL